MNNVEFNHILSREFRLNKSKHTVGGMSCLKSEAHSWSPNNCENSYSVEGPRSYS